jgi:tRNA (guanine-N7-)-methyltransferase
VSRKKQIRFEQNRHRTTLLQAGHPLFPTIRGHWNEVYFRNPNPIVLELGCGRGEYTVGLARRFPGTNFVGVDLKGDRLAWGCEGAEEAGLTNVAFLRTPILELTQYFADHEVAEIWITFPDPRPRIRDIRRRLTAPRFLNLYAHVLQPGGTLHLKTDSDSLFAYSLESLTEFGTSDLTWTTDLHSSSLLGQHHGIQTRFEELALAQGLSIKYLRAQLHPKRPLTPPIVFERPFLQP